MTLWFHILSNQRLDGEIEVTANDSLGFLNLTPHQTVRNDSFAFSTAKVDFVIPMWADIGTRNPVYVQATYNDSFPADSFFDVYVIPTVNVISPVIYIESIPEAALDEFRSFTARNEEGSPGNFEFWATDTEGWEVHTEILQMFMPAKSESTYNVIVNVPEGTETGTVDTICVWMREVGNPPNQEYSCFTMTYTGGTGIDGSLERAKLEQNTPNPFNPKTEIAFTVPLATEVSLVIYDVAGRLVRSLVTDEPMDLGEHVRTWDGLDDGGNRVSSGVYFYRLATDETESIKKMVLLK